MSGSNNHSRIVGSLQFTGINGIDVFRRQTVPQLFCLMQPNLPQLNIGFSPVPQGALQLGFSMSYQQ
jgi:hypothetical protein